MHAPCKRRLLAHDSITRVDICSCGHVHLSIGPLTLRIEPDALHAIGDVMVRAAHVMASDAADDHEPAIPDLDSAPPPDRRRLN